MRATRFPLVAGPLLMALTGCSLIGHLPGQPPPAVTAKLEVFNRTQQDIFLVAADGERLDVPACGRTIDESFRVDEVRVRTERGYIRGFGVGADAAGRHLVLVEVSIASESGIAEERADPNPLPPCRGDPEVQVGI